MPEASPTEDKSAFIRQLEVATAAHDLRNRLSIAHCQVHQLRCQLLRWPCDPSIRSALASVARSLGETSTLLEALLEATADVVRLPASPRQAADIVSLAQRLIAEDPYSGRGQRVELITALPRLTGAWDASRLTMVLEILLHNAMQYSPAGRCVTIEIEANHDWATIIVRDQGLGIPADDLPHVFEPFFRARNVASRTAGLGLGLATARLIIEQYAGVLDVESIEGEGSRFTVCLPRTSI